MRYTLRVSASVLFATLLVVTAFGEFARAASPSPDSPYKIFVGGSSDFTDWICYRINTHTGDISWIGSDANNNSNIWMNVKENEKLPASDYDMQVRTCGTTALNNVNTFVFRLDRKTGRTWLLNNGTMTAVPEAAK